MILLPYPNGASFDFKSESRIAALNEACAGTNVDCSLDSLCPECEALSISIKKRLVRAFAAGRASMGEVSVDVGPDVPGGGAA